MQRAQESNELLHEAELEVLGYTHAQVGGALMDQWNFPGAYKEAVAYHHQPQRASRFPVETAAVRHCRIDHAPAVRRDRHIPHDGTGVGTDVRGDVLQRLWAASADRNLGPACGKIARRAGADAGAAAGNEHRVVVECSQG